MRILLDECVPNRLGRELVGHVARMVPREGWAGRENGELLDLMSAAGDEVLLTVDHGVRHRQNLQAAGVAVILLIVGGNQLADLVPLVSDVFLILGKVPAVDVVEVRA